jgi:hypothetical protein
MVDTGDLKSPAYGVPVRVRLRVPSLAGPLAHAWLEQRTHNPLVRSSTLRGPTTIFGDSYAHV